MPPAAPPTPTGRGARPVAEGVAHPALRVLDLGLIGYAEAVALQERLVEERLRDAAPDTLLLLEHPPVITLGRRGSLDDVYLPEEALARQGIALHRSTRGGLATYHGPGQVVGYPILRLRPLGLTIPGYVQALERAIVQALAGLGVAAWTHEQHVGVWTEQGKIAAIGIAQSRGVTLHGFAVNLQPDLRHFGLLNPCGLGALGVTSVAAILGRPADVAAFRARISRTVARELGLRFDAAERALSPSRLG